MVHLGPGSPAGRGPRKALDETHYSALMATLNSSRWNSWSRLVCSNSNGRYPPGLRAGVLLIQHDRANSIALAITTSFAQVEAGALRGIGQGCLREDKVTFAPLEAAPIAHDRAGPIAQD